MEIKFENNKEITVYELEYDENKVRELMSKIAKECSFKLKGTFNDLGDNKKLYVSSKEEAIDRITKATNEEGMKVYQDLDSDSIKLNLYSTWRHGYPYLVSFNAIKNIFPMLYQLLDGILNGYEKSYFTFYNYFNSKEFKTYEDREEAIIRQLQYLVLEMKKIDGNLSCIEDIVKELKVLKEEMDTNKDYDFNKLRDYYFEACELFNLKEV